MSAAGRALAWLVVAAAYLGLWFLLTDTLTFPELVAGIATAAIGVVATALVAPELRLRPPLPGLMSVVRIPAEVVRDTVRVLVVLGGHLLRVRPAHGVIRVEPFDVGRTDARSAGRRAGATLRRAVTPNTVPIGFDREAGAMLYHELYPASSGRTRGRRA